MNKEKAIYQLKVTLKDVKPPVWRRLRIPSDATFWELHIAIQDSFGWWDYHLHEFFIGPAWDRDSTRIIIPNPYDDPFGEESDPVDESKARLSDYLTVRNPRINYVYDFGDSWEHQVELEEMLPFNKSQKYPQVIAGKRACPFEDSGGSWGYMDKIKILKDKNHPEFKDIADWLNVESLEELDIDHFDPAEVGFRNPRTELRKVLKAMKDE